MMTYVQHTQVPRGDLHFNLTKQTVDQKFTLNIIEIEKMKRLLTLSNKTLNKRKLLVGIYKI